MLMALKRVIIIAAIACAAVLTLTAQPTLGGQSAKQLQKKIEQNRAERDQKFDRIRELKKEKGALSDVLNGVDKQIEIRTTEIESIQLHLDTATLDLENANSKREILTNQLSVGKETLSQRVCAIYMLGEIKLIDVVFQATDFNDLLNRIFFVITILENDQVLINDVQVQQELLYDEMSSIEQKINDISQIKAQLDEQKEVLEGYKSQKQNDLEAIEQDEELFLRQARELEEENKRFANMIRESRRTASGYPGKPWTGNFHRPCAGPITSGFGNRIHPIYGYRKMHTGVDIGATTGTTIKLAKAR